MKLKILRWNAGRGFGFAAPFKGEAPDDVGDVFVHFEALCLCLKAKHWREFEEREYMREEHAIPRGTVVHGHDVAKDDRGRYSARVAECDVCAQRRANDAARGRAIVRIAALFADGHKFDVGAEYPYFYRYGDAGRNPILDAFECAAIEAAAADACDAAITLYAEKAAREAHARHVNRVEAWFDTRLTGGSR